MKFLDDRQPLFRRVEQELDDMLVNSFNLPAAPATTTANTMTASKPLSIDALLEAVDKVKEIKDPLEGADLLIAGGKDGIDGAKQIQAVGFRRIRVEFNPAVPADQIWCMDSRTMNLVKVLKVEKKRDAA